MNVNLAMWNVYSCHRMWNPVSNNLSVGFLTTVSLSADDAVLPDIAIKTNKNREIKKKKQK